MSRAKLEKAFNDWLLTRPECIQKLAKEFPAGRNYLIDGVKYYILGWTEGDTLIFTRINPAKDYDGAMASKEYMCAKHLRGRVEKGYIQ